MFYIQPKGRDKKAAEGYKFLRWFLRKQKREIESVIQNAFLDNILNGSYRPRVFWENKMGG